MGNPAVVVITGGIGSGKSTTALLFAECGVPVLDCDVVARAIHQDPQHPATREIAVLLPEAVDATGKLRRGSLLNLFSRDAEANRLIKRILATHVLDVARQWTAQQTAPYVLWESALLLDCPADIARVVTVDAPEALRYARVLLRNPMWSEADVDRVAGMQPTAEQYRVRADVVLTNAGDLDTLRRAVGRLHMELLTQWLTRRVK